MQNFAKVAFASAVLAFSVSPAIGAAAASQATLATPLAAPKLVIIDGKVWKCTGVDCVAPNEGSAQPLRRECARAVKVLGKVTAYSRDGVSLDAESLAVCNAAA